jgi:TPR repeat protein
MTALDRRRPLPYFTGLYCYLISLGIVAGATVGACYGSALVLLQEPTKGSNAVASGRDPGRAIVLSRLAAAADKISRVAREDAPSAARARSALHVSNGAPSRAKTPSSLPSLPTIGRVQSMRSRPAAMPLSPPVTGEKPPPASRLSDAEVAALTMRGDGLLSIGDIASARLYYERAADAGSGEAAFRMAAVLDPAFLSQIGAQSVAGDPAKARFWYRRARELGALGTRPPMSDSPTN